MKRKLLTLLALISLNIYGQDTLYLGEFGKEIVPRSQAKYFNIVEPDDSDQDLFVVNQYHLNNTLRSTTTYSNYYSKEKERLTYTTYYKSGQIHVEISYKQGKVDGPFLSHWENGTLKRKDVFKKGEFIEGQCWNEEGEPVPYYDMSIHPKFPGGPTAISKYIASNLDAAKIPESSFGSKILISFYIEKDGSVADVELISGVDPLTNSQALRIVREMPDWSPAMQDGNPVKVKRTIPISL